MYQIVYSLLYTVYINWVYTIYPICYNKIYERYTCEKKVVDIYIYPNVNL